MKKKTYIVSLICVLTIGVQAQDVRDNTERIIADIYEQVSEDAETEIDFTSLYEDLIELENKKKDFYKNLARIKHLLYVSRKGYLKVNEILFEIFTLFFFT